ncbi:MAG: S41 family peptidase [Chloroflexota bacterium]
MTYYDPNKENEPPRTNRRFLGLIAIGAVVLCTLTAVAGYSLGRASATPQATAIIEEPAEENTPVVEEVATEAVVEEFSSEEVPAESEPVDEVEPNETDVAEVEEPVESPEEPTAVPTDEPAQIEPTQEPFDLDSLDLSLLEEAWSIIDGEFYGDLPSNDELIYSAIEGSLEILDDPHTSFSNPDTAQSLRESLNGSFEGIGAFVGETDDGFIEIVSPIPEQPAEKVGLQPGDLIIEVDGENVVGQSVLDVASKVRGPRGTDVVLTILRPSTEEELIFTITRDRIELPNVASEMLEGDIGYVSLLSFTSLAGDQVNEAVAEILEQNPQGLIFDLRNNGGGFLNQSVVIADIFMTENIVLYQRDNQGNEQIFRADDGDIAEEIPLVVLVNASSASASEIVTAAIQDTGRGTIIGDLTFGKGSVQQVHTLSDGSELRVTIARFFSPNDNVINNVGITPDIEIADDFDTDVDEQLERAIEFLLTGE